MGAERRRSRALSRRELLARGTAGVIVLGSRGFSRRSEARGLAGCRSGGPNQLAALLPALSREQRVGQLFMVGLKSGATQADTAQTATALQSFHVGNLVLVGSGWDSSAQIRGAVTPLQQTARDANSGIALFVSGNQEGGQWGAFQAFYGPGFSAIPSPIAQAEGDPGRLQEQARIWGVQLLNAGVNLNLAPVLDTVPSAIAADNAPIGYWGREYGFTPEDVGTYGVAFERGMLAAPVAVAIKHFPGLGRVSGNTDFTDQGIVDATFSGLDDPYLLPYKLGIDAGASFVMMSLGVYPQVDPDIAAFSPAMINDILRAGLGFTGVVISDDLGQAAAVAQLTPAERALSFFGAGGDVLLTVVPADIEPMTAAIVERMAADSDFAASIERSVLRVLQAKAAQGLLPDAC